MRVSIPQSENDCGCDSARETREREINEVSFVFPGRRYSQNTFVTFKTRRDDADCSSFEVSRYRCWESGWSSQCLSSISFLRLMINIISHEMRYHRLSFSFCPPFPPMNNLSYYFVIAFLVFLFFLSLLSVIVTARRRGAAPPRSLWLLVDYLLLRLCM